MMKEVFPKTEMLKRKILEKFHQDYDAFQEENVSFDQVISDKFCC